MNADRETLGPANLSRVFTRSSDNVNDVFIFIPWNSTNQPRCET
jgi:hypothetical protein